MNLIPWKKKQLESESTESSPLAALRNEVDRLFESYLREPIGAIDWPWGGAKWTPAVDVAENDKEVTIRAEIPGIDPDDLEVTVTGNQLILSGEKRESTESREQGYYHSESRYGTFRRSLPLPEGVDTEDVDAQYANGVLTIRLKKTGAAEAKRIEIKTQG